MATFLTRIFEASKMCRYRSNFLLNFIHVIMFVSMNKFVLIGSYVCVSFEY